ncbi:MAG: hypothetical protein IT516_17265 [Burkholderiales bacterium]|nr:hypothetical protein [Burkholderiales bacterium]
MRQQTLLSRALSLAKADASAGLNPFGRALGDAEYERDEVIFTTLVANAEAFTR